MFAARLTSLTSHGGLINPPVATNVFFEGLPAAHLGSLHFCPLYGHPPGGVMTSGYRVLVNSFPLARLGDHTPCGAQITSGASSLIVGG